MKIKELLESLSEVKRYITEIRINGFKFGEFDEYKIKRNSFEGLNEYKELEVKSWKVSVEDYKAILIVHVEDLPKTQKKTKRKKRMNSLYQIH